MLGTGTAIVGHLRLLTAKQSSLSRLAEIKLPGREGLTQPPPPARLSVGPHLMGKCYKISRTSSRTPCRCISIREKPERETPKGSVLNFSQGNKKHLFLGPIPLRPAKQGKPKSVQQEKIRTPPHTELPSAPSRKKLTLLHRLAPHIK